MDNSIKFKFVVQYCSAQKLDMKDMSNNEQIFTGKLLKSKLKNVLKLNYVYSTLEQSGISDVDFGYKSAEDKRNR